MKQYYTCLKKLILIPLLVLMAMSLNAQERTISGVVSDAQTGETLPGANIVVKGTQRGTITGTQGEFELKIPEGADSLVITFIGYQKSTIRIADKSVFNIKLQRKVTGLDEVVVIGYGTVKKSDLTGSVSTVKSEELTKIPSSNALEALQGKISGAQISSGSGEPGSNPIVRVRGIGTLNNANPIYVVDGVIVDDISFLSSNDIQSVELLKDASATAIYGSRGSNGVFIITTKSGGENIEPQITFKTEYGVQQLENKIDLLNGREFAMALNDISPGTINNLDAVANYDWQDAIFRENPVIQSYDLSVAGGNDKLNYYLGTGFFDREGIIPKSNFKRYNLKLNTKYKAKDYLTFGANISGAYSNDDNAPNVVGTAYRAWPIDTPYDENGNFAEVRGNGNPLAAIEYTHNYTKTYRLVGNLFTEIKFLDDFRFKSSYQLDMSHGKNRNFTPEFYVSATQQNPRNALSIDFTEDRTWIWENTINYDKEFDNHTINAVAGFTAQERYFESPTVTVYRLVREDPLFWYFNATLTDTVDVSNNLGDAYQTSMISYLFRTNYSYKKRYMATVSFRADGSSKFREDKRYGYFPSFALGWNLSNEPFFPELKNINKIKLRGSWGIVGNEKISWFDRYSLFGSQYGAVFGDPEKLQPGAAFFSAGNNDLIWESTKQANFGIELGAFRDKLTAEIDYYRKLTDDILVLLDVPGFYGYGSFQQVRFNAASVLNSGIEMHVSYKDEISDDLRYSLNLTGSTVHNEVMELGATTPTDSVIYGGALSNGKRVTATRVGESIGYFIGYEVDGIFQNEQQLEQYPHLTDQDVGDLRYVDQNGDGKITPDDRVKIGSPIPDFTFGMGFNVSYKGLSLSVDLQGQVGNELYNAKNQTRFSVYNFEGRVRDRWTGEGTSTTEPELDGRAGNYEESEYFIEDGSYLRLRTAVLSYDLPDRWMKGAGLTSASLYLRGTNILTLTKYSGYSPDLGGSPLSAGIDSGIYPITSIYTLGLNVKL